MDCTQGDVILGAQYGVPTFITPDEYTQIDRTNLCWTFAGNPSRMNIPVGGVPEMLEIAWLQQWSREAPPPLTELYFNIPSEEGWGQFIDQWHSVEKKSRVTLRTRTYWNPFDRCPRHSADFQKICSRVH